MLKVEKSSERAKLQSEVFWSNWTWWHWLVVTHYVIETPILEYPQKIDLYKNVLLGAAKLECLKKNCNELVHNVIRLPGCNWTTPFHRLQE